MCNIRLCGLVMTTGTNIEYFSFPFRFSSSFYFYFFFSISFRISHHPYHRHLHQQHNERISGDDFEVVDDDPACESIIKWWPLRIIRRVLLIAMIKIMIKLQKRKPSYTSTSALLFLSIISLFIVCSSQLHIPMRKMKLNAYKWLLNERSIDMILFDCAKINRNWDWDFSKGIEMGFNAIRNRK